MTFKPIISKYMPDKYFEMLELLNKSHCLHSSQMEGSLSNFYPQTE